MVGNVCPENLDEVLLCFNTILEREDYNSSLGVVSMWYSYGIYPAPHFKLSFLSGVEETMKFKYFASL